MALGPGHTAPGGEVVGPDVEEEPHRRPQPVPVGVPERFGQVGGARPPPGPRSGLLGLVLRGFVGFVGQGVLHQLPGIGEDRGGQGRGREDPQGAGPPGVEWIGVALGRQRTGELVHRGVHVDRVGRVQVGDQRRHPGPGRLPPQPDEPRAPGGIGARRDQVGGDPGDLTLGECERAGPGEAGNRRGEHGVQLLGLLDAEGMGQPGELAGLPGPDPTDADQLPEPGVAVAQVERVGDQQRGRRVRAAEQRAELDGEELRHPGRALPTETDQLLPTAPRLLGGARPRRGIDQLRDEDQLLGLERDLSATALEQRRSDSADAARHRVEAQVRLSYAHRGHLPRVS